MNMTISGLSALMLSPFVCTISLYDVFLRTLPNDLCITSFGQCNKIIGKRLEVTRYLFCGELKLIIREECPLGDSPSLS